METVKASIFLLGFVFTLAQGARSEDWSQWHGPHRDGVAEKGPPLLAPWPIKGPRKVWESDPIPSEKEGGRGSVVVADGRAYLFVGWKDPLVTRRIRPRDRWLIDLNLVSESKERLPEALAKASEEARLSAERAKLNGEEARAWAEKWVAAHLSDKEMKTFGDVVKARLHGGKKVVPLSTLPKLEEAVKKEFPNQAAVEKYVDEIGIPPNETKTWFLETFVPTVRDETKDAIVCLHRATGRILWKKEYPGAMPDENTAGSSTPAVVGERCYATGCTALYCLNAADGSEIWKNAPPDYAPTCSSPLVVDGVVVIRAGSKLGLAGFDVKDGQLLWNVKKVATGRGCGPSAVAWTKGGKSYVFSNDDRRTYCVEAKTGKLMWSVRGGGGGSPVVSGDYLVTAGGVAAYKLAAEKAEKLWEQDDERSGTTAVVHQGVVYACRACHLVCTKLDDGKIMWKQPGNFCGGDFVEYSSPSLADGKLFAIGERGTLYMFKASPEKFQLLGKVDGADAVDCTTPAIADGRMYVRMKRSVVCFDLAKPGG
jgi:outer membrane protein assembly factor BamB